MTKALTDRIAELESEVAALRAQLAAAAPIGAGGSAPHPAWNLPAPNMCLNRGNVNVTITMDTPMLARGGYVTSGVEGILPLLRGSGGRIGIPNRGGR